MKATGVVRRIDDLGRIVIPIEIRRNMNIRDGDPLEIFVDKQGEVILKKYSAIAELGQFVQEIADSLYEATGKLTMITDRDTVVTVAGGPDKPYVNKPIGPIVTQAMESRSTLSFEGEEHEHEGPLLGHGENCEFYSELITPIIVAGDPVGTIIITGEEQESLSDPESKLASTAAGFLARHMSE